MIHAFARLAAGLVCVSVFVPQAVAESLLDLVPSDVKAVAVAGDLEQLQTKFEGFVQNAQLPLPPGASVDALAQTSGLGDLWDVKRGLAVALIEPSNNGAILLLPVTDAQAALEKLGAQKQGDLHSIAVAGLPLVAMAKDNVLVVGFDSQTVKLFSSPASTYADALAGAPDLLSKSDVYIDVNVPQWKELIDMGAAIAEGQLANLADLPAQPQGMDPKLMVGMFQWYLSGAKTILSQTEHVQLGLSVQPTHVKMTKSVLLKDGSKLQAIAAKAQSKNKDLLQSIPSMPFYMAMGMDTSGFSETFSEIIASMWELDAFKEKLEPETREVTLKKASEFYEMLNGFNMVMEFGESGMTMLGRYDVDDPEKASQSMRELFKLNEQLMTMYFPFGMDSEAVEKKVNGVDVLEFKFVYGDEMPAEIKEVMKKVYGDNIRFQIGQVGNALGFAMSSKAEPIAELTNVNAPLSAEKRIATALGDLPEERIGVILIDPLGMVRMAKNMAGQFGAQMNFELPAQAPPPVAMAITTTPKTIGGDVVVRADMVAAMVKIFSQLRP